MTVQSFTVAGERCYARPESPESAEVALCVSCGRLIHGPDLPAATLSHRLHCPMVAHRFYRWL